MEPASSDAQCMCICVAFGFDLAEARFPVQSTNCVRELTTIDVGDMVRTTLLQKDRLLVSFGSYDMKATRVCIFDLNR